MSKFKVGDRIRHRISGETGTIRLIDSTSVPYGIEFDNEIQGLYYSLQGTCEIGHDLWVSEEDIELLINSTLEDYTTKELEEELKKRKEKEREEIIKELRKYIDKPVHWHELPKHTYGFDLFLADDKEFQTYCDAKTTAKLKEELKNRKENKINEILEVINNNIKKLRELGYTIPYKDNTIIDSLELNKVFDKIGVFYE